MEFISNFNVRQQDMVDLLGMYGDLEYKGIDINKPGQSWAWLGGLTHWCGLKHAVHSAPLQCHRARSVVQESTMVQPMRAGPRRRASEL